MLAATGVVITDTDRMRLKELSESLRSLRGPYTGYVGELEEQMHLASSVPATEIDPQVITMNSRFVVRDRRTGRLETFTLVYRSDCGGLDGSVSVLTPLGASLLGARVGDVIEWRFRGGVRELKIEQVLYQPEAAGDFHL
jgi:regulator of nucleoside diphosphate kinase